MSERLLFSSLRGDAVWWSPSWDALGWRLALAVVVGRVNESSALLPAAVFAVLAVACVVHQWKWPHRHSTDNIAHSAVLLAALFVYLLEIVAGAAHAAQPGGGDESVVAARVTVVLVRVGVLAGLGLTIWKRERLEDHIVTSRRSAASLFARSEAALD